MAAIFPTSASDIPESLSRRVSSARAVTVLTGAGISAPSGLPTFRDKEEGLWAKYDPRTLATPEAFARDPALVWAWYEWRRNAVAAAQPNEAHHALKMMERQYDCFTLLTQNVDDLHERAGSQAVQHLHGRLLVSRCITCGKTEEWRPQKRISKEFSQRLLPPTCEVCGNILRPDVVWFGEEPPRDVLERGRSASAGCDMFLCIGTAATVYPAAELPFEAKQSGAVLVVVNKARSGADRYADYVLRGDAATILPLIVQLRDHSGPHQIGTRQ